MTAVPVDCAEAGAVESAANANKATHIFDNAKHNLDGVVTLWVGKLRRSKPYRKSRQKQRRGYQDSSRQSSNWVAKVSRLKVP